MFFDGARVRATVEEVVSIAGGVAAAAAAELD